MILLAAVGGVWLFYVQHQFDGVYWSRSKDWDFVAACLEGGSWYKLPKVLAWFTGWIGFHHIHHLNSRIPNYHLERCHYRHPIFSTAKKITFFSAFKSIRFRLWDENESRLVGYKRVRDGNTNNRK
jgi:omega-6 fatty acid desaturase (delta-12 desaturase)